MSGEQLVFILKKGGGGVGANRKKNTSSQPEDDEFSRVLEAVDQRVTDEMNGTLLEPYTGEEVR